MRERLAHRYQPNAPMILLLDRGFSWTRRSRLASFKRLARTFAHHRAGIERIVAAANSNARRVDQRGYSGADQPRPWLPTLANLRTIVYLTLGGLRLPNSPFRPVLTPA